MARNPFWKKSYPAGMTDLDPREWETTFPEITRKVFRDYPGKTALAFMGTHVTYAQLDRYANRFANMLLSCGLKRGTVVGINLPNLPQYVIAWLGTLRAGCVVSGVSPLLSSEEMAYQLEDSQAKALVTLDALFGPRVVPAARDLNKLEVIVTAGIGDFLPPVKGLLGKLLGRIPKGPVYPLEGRTVFTFGDVIGTEKYSDRDPVPGLTPDDPAYLQYTGGTTGVPKGAMLNHRNTVADLLIFQRWLGFKPGDFTALTGFPFFHIAGIFTCANFIYLGWTQILIPDPRNTGHICHELGKYRPVAMANVPPFYMLLTADPKLKKLDHSAMQVCISAAAPFPDEPQDAFEAIVGKGKVIEGYGMTETSPLTIFNPVGGKRKPGTIGLPLPNTEVRLVDPATGSEVEPGQAGEICVRGPHVMMGYFNRPEETRQVIDSEGYIHTGDVAIQDEEGYLRLVDRTKDMINVGGFKVFSRKVEEVLCRHPAVCLAATIGVSNPERPGSELVKAVLTLNSGYDKEENREKLKAEILNFARERLTPYEIPKELEIRKELPLTTVGKIDKKALRKEARDRAGG